MNPFQFTIPAPTIKCDNLASYKAALEAWQASVQWAVATHPELFQAPGIPANCHTAPPAIPSAPSAPFVPSDVKGPWEGKALAAMQALAIKDGKRPPKFLRFTRGKAIGYASREDYFQAVYEGRESGDSGEDSGEDAPPPVPVIPDASEVDGLH